MKKFLLITIFTASLFVTAQQVGINDTGNAPDLSAGLDVAFSDKGVLVPRMDVTNRNNISNPANGLIVYNTDCNILNYYDCDTWREVREIFGFPNQANGLEIVSGNTNPSQNQQGVVYSVPPITGAVTYSWTLPNGASIATGAGTNRITVDFTTPGDGYVCVSAVNSCGTEVKACLLVDICPLPTVAPMREMQRQIKAKAG